MGARNCGDVANKRRILSFVRSSIGFLFALLLGAFLIFSGFRGYPFAMDSLVGGVTTILGALACRNATERRQGLRPDTKPRRVAEIAFVALVCLPLVILLAEGNDALFFYPLSGIIVPGGTLIAFLWLVARRNHASGGSIPSIR
jgi:hypothetical protein